MAWQKNGNTSGAGLDDLTLDSALQFNQVLENFISGVTSSSTVLRVGTDEVDSTGNYADRFSLDGAGDLTGINQTDIRTAPAALVSGSESFKIMYILNISGEEKLAINFSVDNSAGEGAGFPPARLESVGKWVTSTQFNHIGLGLTTADALSDLTALGTN